MMMPYDAWTFLSHPHVVGVVLQAMESDTRLWDTQVPVTLVAPLIGGLSLACAAQFKLNRSLIQFARQDSARKDAQIDYLLATLAATRGRSDGN